VAALHSLWKTTRWLSLTSGIGKLGLSVESRLRSPWDHHLGLPRIEARYSGSVVTSGAGTTATVWCWERPELWSGSCEARIISLLHLLFFLVLDRTVLRRLVRYFQARGWSRVPPATPRPLVVVLVRVFDLKFYLT
jgi:hypothetical protein